MAIDIKSPTIQNLEAAFAGECMAHAKYRYFAKVVRELGDEETARVFEETADQEVQHALRSPRPALPQNEAFRRPRVEVVLVERHLVAEVVEDPKGLVRVPEAAGQPELVQRPKVGEIGVVLPDLASPLERLEAEAVDELGSPIGQPADRRPVEAALAHEPRVEAGGVQSDLVSLPEEALGDLGHEALGASRRGEVRRDDGEIAALGAHGAASPAEARSGLQSASKAAS